tara:strand:+ start:823 stop:1092 length:270 start_codon:yes stop_codon:yes gene_type:complete
MNKIDKFSSMLKLYIIGLSILFIAIIANTLAGYLNLNTWYGFANEIIQSNFIIAINKQNIEDLIWLFIIYPIVLSSGYLIGSKINVLIF